MYFDLLWMICCTTCFYSWQDFDWHSASRGPSAVAALLVSWYQTAWRNANDDTQTPIRNTRAHENFALFRNKLATFWIFLQNRYTATFGSDTLCQKVALTDLSHSKPSVNFWSCFPWISWRATCRLSLWYTQPNKEKEWSLISEFKFPHTDAQSPILQYVADLLRSKFTKLYNVYNNSAASGV